MNFNELYKVVITAFVVILFALGYHFGLFTDSEPKQTEVIETEKGEVSYFEQNALCAKQKSSIQEEIDDWNKRHALPEPGLSMIAVLEEIFYSPRDDTCLYIREITDVGGSDLDYVIDREVYDYKMGMDVDPITWCQYIDSFKAARQRKSYELEGNEFMIEYIDSTQNNRRYSCEIFDRRIKALKGQHE